MSQQIKEGDKIPSGSLTSKGELGIQNYDPAEIFAKGTHILFSVPGAFTPTCSEKHLPGYVSLANELAEQGVQSINCVSVNDAFVMKSWLLSYTNGEKIKGIADGNAEFSKSLNLLIDKSSSFMGSRCKRFAFIIENAIIKKIKKKICMRKKDNGTKSKSIRF